MSVRITKLISLGLVLLLFLCAVGCEKSSVATGELNASSPASDESTITDLPSEELPTLESETAEPASATEPASVLGSDAEASAQPPSPVQSSEPAPVSPDRPASSVVAPVSSGSVAPAAFFSPPDHPSVYEHVEYSLEDLVAWINSDEALTEESGVYRAAVEYWRRRGTVYLASLPQTVSKIDWCKLWSDGKVSVTFEDGFGYVAIFPFNESEATAVSDGIVSYFEAKGKTVASGPVTMTDTASALDLSTRFVERSLSVANNATDAVLEIRPYELSNGKTIYVRFLHWFQNGFRMCYHFMDANTPEDAAAVNEFPLSQLQFSNVSLSETAE